MSCYISLIMFSRATAAGAHGIAPWPKGSGNDKNNFYRLAEKSSAQHALSLSWLTFRLFSADNWKCFSQMKIQVLIQEVDDVWRSNPRAFSSRRVAEFRQSHREKGESQHSSSKPLEGEWRNVTLFKLGLWDRCFFFHPFPTVHPIPH